MSTKEWSVAYWHYMPGASSPMQMMKGAMKCMQCGGVKEGETVLISTDTNKLRIAEALGGAAYAVGATPIIIMTAMMDPALKEKGLEAGADLAIPKPFDPMQIVTLLNDALVLASKRRRKG